MSFTGRPAVLVDGIGVCSTAILFALIDYNRRDFGRLYRLINA